MKKKKKPSKESRSPLKKITATAALAGSLLVSTPSIAKAAKHDREALQRRVQVVREALKNQADAQRDEAKETYADAESPQWGNWGNWGNWNNWRNWNNWNNWGNWGNWRNR